MVGILAKNLARNLIILRQKQGLSQVQLAKVAQIPRSTLTYIESGESNPSLSSLGKLSEALQISVEELLSQPLSSTQLIKSDDVTKIKKSKNTVVIDKILPDPIPGMEIDRMVFEPNGKLRGTPHTHRTKEYLYCSEGLINVYVDKKRYELKIGDVLSFPGDEPHAYENPSLSKRSKCFSVVVFAPTGIY